MTSIKQCCTMLCKLKHVSSWVNMERIRLNGEGNSMKDWYKGGIQNRRLALYYTVFIKQFTISYCWWPRDRGDSSASWWRPAQLPGDGRCCRSTVRPGPSEAAQWPHRLGSEWCRRGRPGRCRGSWSRTPCTQTGWTGSLWDCILQIYPWPALGILL